MRGVRSPCLRACRSPASAAVLTAASLVQGGGSIFGVLISVTLKTCPSPKLSAITIVIGTYADSSAAQYTFDMIAYVLSQYPSLGDAGVSCYSYVFSDQPNPLDGGATTLGGVLATLALQDTEDPAPMTKPWQPILAHINATWPDFFSLTIDQTGYASFWDWFQNQVDYDTSPGGHRHLRRLAAA